MAEAKHSFVDDNPYLVYSPNAETTFDGNSGGGGTGFQVVEVTDDETSELSVTAGELAEMLENSPVIVVRHDVNSDSDPSDTLWEFISSYINDDGAYSFSSFSAILGLGGTSGYFTTRIASSADDYPVLD